MKLDDVINLSLYYRNKKELYNFTSEEIISIGYNAFLQSDKLFNCKLGVKKTTYFMQILEWNIREEFREKSIIKIPKDAWHKGIRTKVSNLEINNYAKTNSYETNYDFDTYEHLYDILNELPERLKFILNHKYELQGKEKMTFKTIAKKMNLSPQRIRVLHENALKKLKQKYKFQ